MYRTHELYLNISPYVKLVHRLFHVVNGIQATKILYIFVRFPDPRYMHRVSKVLLQSLRDIRRIHFLFLVMHGFQVAKNLYI